MKTLNCNEVKQISIIDYLFKIEITPKQIRGNDYWYQSPFRDEQDASFKVNSKLNRWYDHGIGEGGNLVDLGIRLYNCSIEDFLRKVTDEQDLLSFHKQSMDLSGRQNVQPARSEIDIQKVNVIVSPALIQYIELRGISLAIARAYCKEVNFTIADKNYYAIGFENRSGGYELRNEWFKGSSTPKDITFIERASPTINIFEGFIDFLSFQQLQTKPEVTNSLILNSNSNFQKSLEFVIEHSEINLYLDSDQSGRNTTQLYRNAGIIIRDHSAIYQGYKDLNEYLNNTNHVQQNVTSFRGRKR